jgi:hypothetical protein
MIPRDDYERLLAIDAILIKASGIPGTEAVFMNLERRLLQFISRIWVEAAESAVKRIMSNYMYGMGAAEAAHAAALPFKNIGNEMKPALLAATRGAYLEGKRQMLMRHHGHLAPLDPSRPHKVRKAPRDDVDIEPDFSLADQKAVDALVDNQVYWIGDYYDDELSSQIQEAVAEAMLKTGIGREEAGRLLQDKIEALLGTAGASVPSGWLGPTGRYFEMVAANAASNGRTRGALGQMGELGVTKYTFNCAADERTCSRCYYLDGRTFEVASALSTIDRINDADDPDAVKQLQPWASSMADVEAKPNDFSMPPIHGSCRCTVDISEDTELTF